jgi:L-amino acid N-acyltransferase YncA
VERNSVAETTIVVRDARDEDIAALAALYGHHVLHGVATFEVEPPDEAEMGRRLHDLTGRGFPWLVAESVTSGAGGSGSAMKGTPRLLGFAYAGPYRSRVAWRYTVEDSIYVHPDATGRGVGRLLLQRLLEICVQRGYRQMVAVIGDSANAASIKLHAACGFEHVGTLRNVGIKFGRWVDSVLMQCALGDGASIIPAENQSPGS